MNEIHALRLAAGLTQAAFAEAGGTSQPTVAAYEAGHKSPTLSTLRRLAHSVALDAFVTFHPPLTREERRSLALHRAIARRLLAEPEAALRQARQTLARMSLSVAANSTLLSEWALILERPIASIVDVLLDPSPWARELRHVTPFAGVLSAQERASVYLTFGPSDNAALR